METHPLISNASNVSSISNVSKIQCCYFNNTTNLQVICLKPLGATRATAKHREQVLFPMQRFVFESCSGDKIEIYNWSGLKPVLSQSTTADQLAVQSRSLPAVSRSNRSVAARSQTPGSPKAARMRAYPASIA